VSITIIALSCTKEPVGPISSGPDTTSHNFTWNQYTFGGSAGSCSFNDVAVINDSDIWAAGIIYTATDTLTYNAVHWDGKSWTLKQILFHATCTQSYMGSYEITAVCAFGSNDVWFCDGGELVHWNGISYQTDCSILPLASGELRKMWGSSSSDMYLVGYNGALIHYVNGVGQKLTSGTNASIPDIWGGINPTGQEEVIAVTSNGVAFPQVKGILQISGNTVTAVNDSGLSTFLSTAWFTPGWKYFAGGDRIYSTSVIGNNWGADTVLEPPQYTFSIRGIAKNDIFMVGGYGLVSHWNGQTLKQYTELGSFYGNYYSLSFKGNTVAAAGAFLGNTIYSYAAVLVGQRR